MTQPDDIRIGMEFEGDLATPEQVKKAVRYCFRMPDDTDINIFIPADWREIGQFWSTGNRFGQWDVDGHMILVMEYPPLGEAFVVHEEGQELREEGKAQGPAGGVGSGTDATQAQAPSIPEEHEGQFLAPQARDVPGQDHRRRR